MVAGRREGVHRMLPLATAQQPGNETWTNSPRLGMATREADLTDTETTRWSSGEEGAALAARRGSLRQGSAPRPTMRGGEVVSRAAHGEPWRQKTELNFGAYRSGQEVAVV
jgi:hypothetical protein